MNKNYLKLFLAFLAFIVLAYLYFKYDPLSILFPKCPLYVTTGVYCPGCGSQRATHSLLHFDLAGVVKSNLLFLPAMLLIGYHYSISILNHFLNKNYSSILDKSKAPIVILIIVLLFFILRNIPVEPFTYLAP